eukprot:Gb_29227 [translate_table: standard]
MLKSSNYGLDNGSDFQLPEEILSVLPTDPYEQLDLARKITSIAIASRVSKLEAEAVKLRHKIAEKDHIIHGLQEKIAQLEQGLSETNERLSYALDDQAKLTNEKNVLAATVKKLNRDVAKLETFKKTLMQSLQEDDEAPQAEGAQNTAAQRSASLKSSFSSSLREEDSGARSSEVPSVLVETSSSIPEDDSHSEVLASRHAASKGFSLTPHNITPQLTPTGSPKRLSAAGSPKRLSPQESPRRHSTSVSPTRHQFEGRVSFSASLPASHHATAPNSPPRGGSHTARAARVDGKEFFRQARSRLSFEQFSAFLANIKELNSHRQTREETLRKADDIFGSENKDLYVIFEGLLSRHLP